MSKKSFLGGAAILGISGLIVKIIGALYRIPLANIIRTEGMAYYNTAYYVYSFLLVVSSAGIPTAISKMVSERMAYDDDAGAYAVFKHSYKLLFGLGVVTAVIMAVMAKPYDWLTSINGSYLSLLALAPALLFVSLISAYRGYFQGRQNMVPTGVSQVVEQIGKLAVGFPMASALMAYGPQYGAMGAIIGVTVSELVALLFLIVYHMQHRRSLYPTGLTSATGEQVSFRAVARRLLKIAVPVTLGASIMPLTSMMDTLIVANRLRGIGYSEQLAKDTYGLLGGYVNPLVNMPAVLTLALCMSLVPAISTAAAQKKPEEVRTAGGLGIKLAMCIGMPCAVGLFVLAKPVLSLLFSSLEPQMLGVAAELLQVASVGIVFLSLVQSVTGVLQGIGKPGVPVVNLAIGAALKLVISYVLIGLPHINIVGASVGSVVCYATAGILDTVQAVRRTGMRFSLLNFIGKPLLASLLMGAAVYFGYYGLLEGMAGPRLGLVIVILLAVFIYGSVLVLTKTFNADDFEFIPGGQRLYALLKRIGLYS